MEREIKETIPFTIATKRIKYLGLNLPKEIKNVYIEYYYNTEERKKILHKWMEKYTMFLDWKNQYSGNEYATQSNLKIQCNPYQATNGILQKTRTNNFTICMEIQKNLEQPKQTCEREMELEESTFLTLDYPRKLQSSRQYGTVINTKIQINGTIQEPQREIYVPMDTLSLTEEAKIYNGEKANSLTSGAGVTCQPSVKE